MDRLVGRTLGEFVVGPPLGAGGFGTVYRAEQTLLRRSAVVKVLNVAHRGDPLVIERFLREAQLASQLDHPYKKKASRSKLNLAKRPVRTLSEQELTGVGGGGSLVHCMTQPTHATTTG